MDIKHLIKKSLNNRIVFLDDIREPYYCSKYMPVHYIPFYLSDLNWKIVRNYNEFVEDINANGLPYLYSLDHDLGEGKTGMDCVKYLVNYCMDNNAKIPITIIHSANPVGADNMRSYIDNFKKNYYI